MTKTTTLIVVLAVILSSVTAIHTVDYHLQFIEDGCVDLFDQDIGVCSYESTSPYVGVSQLDCIQTEADAGNVSTTCRERLEEFPAMECMSVMTTECSDTNDVLEGMQCLVEFYDDNAGDVGGCSEIVWGSPAYYCDEICQDYDDILECLLDEDNVDLTSNEDCYDEIEDILDWLAVYDWTETSEDVPVAADWESGDRNEISYGLDDDSLSQDAARAWLYGVVDGDIPEVFSFSYWDLYGEVWIPAIIGFCCLTILIIVKFRLCVGCCCCKDDDSRPKNTEVSYMRRQSFAWSETTNSKYHSAPRSYRTKHQGSRGKRHIPKSKPVLNRQSSRSKKKRASVVVPVTKNLPASRRVANTQFLGKPTLSRKKNQGHYPVRLQLAQL